MDGGESARARLGSCRDEEGDELYSCRDAEGDKLHSMCDATRSEGWAHTDPGTPRVCAGRAREYVLCCWRIWLGNA